MKNLVIKTVKHYFKEMLDVDIDICKSFYFDNCKSSSVNIKTSKSTHKFIINIESDSLIILSKRLFGLSSDELTDDLLLELANTLGGFYAENFYKKDYTLSLPQIEKICDTKYAVYFKNEDFKLCAKIKVL